MNFSSNTIKIVIVRGDLNTDPILAEYDEEHILPTKGMIVRKMNLKGRVVENGNIKDPGQIFLCVVVSSIVAEAVVAAEIDGMLHLESCVHTKRKT